MIRQDADGRRQKSSPLNLGTSVATLALFFVISLGAASDSAAQSVTSDSPEAPSHVLPPALSGKERWHLYLDENYLSPGIYFASFGSALGGHAANDPRDWGGGFKGYGGRAASQYGLFAIQNTIHDGGAAALGYEPRYFRCQCTGVWRRTGHAFEMTFLTYDQHGHKRLDLPQLAGAYGSGMISTLWYPKGYSPLVQGVQAGHAQLGFVAGIHLIQEFSPEIKRTWPFNKKFTRRSGRD
jgi:hypothetical protein